MPGVLPCFAGLGPALPRARPSARGAVPLCAAVSPRRVLVVNTDGGGHGIIGPHLAEALLADGHQVAVRQSGAPDATTPCERYAMLSDRYPSRFSLSYGSADASAVPPGTFDAVFDNCSKKPGDADAVIDAAHAGAELFYVSSAGAYNYDPNVAPHLAGEGAAGPTIDVENQMRAAGVSSAVFRPIYIIGPASAKREYTDFFFDRIVRGRSIPVPGHPSNLVSITDARDVASMMACALGKGFKGAIFNSVAPRAITVQGIVNMCAEVAGLAPPEIVAYDPDVVAKRVQGFKVKKAFPYRPRHFYAEPFLNPEAAALLEWTPRYSSNHDELKASFGESYAEYVQRGLDRAYVDFSVDDAIMAAVSGIPVP